MPAKSKPRSLPKDKNPLLHPADSRTPLSPYRPHTVRIVVVDPVLVVDPMLVVRVDPVLAVVACAGGGCPCWRCSRNTLIIDETLLGRCKQQKVVFDTFSLNVMRLKIPVPKTPGSDLVGGQKFITRMKDTDFFQVLSMYPPFLVPVRVWLCCVVLCGVVWFMCYGGGYCVGARGARVRAVVLMD